MATILSSASKDREEADRTAETIERCSTQDAGDFLPIEIPASEKDGSVPPDEFDEDGVQVQRHPLACIDPIDPDDGDDWSDFWLCHPALTRVFVIAERRNLAPMALLVALLTVAGAAADHRWCIVIDDAPSPITLFMALISPSGAGKSKAVSAAMSLIGLDPERCRCVQPAHLAGLIDSFGEEVETETGRKNAKGQPILAKQWKQTRNAALVMMDELQRMEALAKKFDDDLLPGLRSAWSGKEMATSNVKAGGRYRFLPAGSFTVSMAASGTPESVGPWLQRVDGTGDGDRTLVISAMDGSPSRRRTEEQLTADPTLAAAPLATGTTPVAQQLELDPATAAQHPAPNPSPPTDEKWTLTPPVSDDPTRNLWRVAVAPEIVEQVRAANRDRNRGVTVEHCEWLGISGHLELLRLRVAACWSLLRHEPPAGIDPDDLLLMPDPLSITVDDWRIAGAVIAWDHSTTLVLEQMQMIESAEARRRKAEAKASEAVVSDTRVEQAQTRRLLERAVGQVANKIIAEDTPLLPSECNQALSGRLRRKWAEMGHGRLIDEVLSDRRFDRVEDGKVALRSGDDAC